MNTTSANKLLKILEDPPPKTLFILVASNTDHILPTILSRTQIIKIPGIDDESMQSALKNTFQLDENETRNIIHLANGNYLTAINLINSDEEYRYNFNMFVQMMRLSYSSKVFEIYQWIDEMTSNGREKLKQYLQYTLRMVRENFITGYNTPSIVYLTNNEKDFSAKFSAFINERNASAITNELDKAYRHIEMNANNKLVFLDLILKLMVLLKK
jgi:DNA polymerase-3 subunit delta'